MANASNKLKSQTRIGLQKTDSCTLLITKNSPYISSNQISF